MVQKIIAAFLIFLSANSFAIVVTEEYLSTLASNWSSLEPAGAYDFIPEDLSYELSEEVVLENLNEALEKAVSEEEYEVAARLRDRIRLLEKKSTPQ